MLTYLEGAQLFVEREELDVDGAERLVDGGRFPHHLPVVVHRRFRHQLHREVAISAEKIHTKSEHSEPQWSQAMVPADVAVLCSLL